MQNKVILVTGTNSGFGLRYVHTLSEAGHTVYATMRDVNGRNEKAAEALGQLPGVEVLEVEVTNSSSVQQAVNAIIAKEGRIDVLINNAGHFSGGIAETFTDEDVDKMFDVHVKSTWRTIKEVLPHMRRQKDGLIINTSSVLGRFSSPFMTFYNAAKFAVEGISEGLRYEVRQLGIDVSIIQPGAFPTDIFSKATTGSDATVIESYGSLAQVPDQIGAGIRQILEATKPDPQLVADAVMQLIDLPKGQRPLRTVVDPNTTGAIVKSANEQVSKGYSEFISAFGLQELLN